jgi:hypothetical protein
VREGKIARADERRGGQPGTREGEREGGREGRQGGTEGGREGGRENKGGGVVGFRQIDSVSTEH